MPSIQTQELINESLSDGCEPGQCPSTLTGKAMHFIVPRYTRFRNVKTEQFHYDCLSTPPIPLSWFSSYGHSHTAFNCFVSTARRFFFSRRWETAIFNGDPGVDKNCKIHARFFYQRGLNPTSVWVIHDVLASKLSDLGDSGIALQDASELSLCDLLKRNIIEPTVFTASTQN